MWAGWRASGKAPSPPPRRAPRASAASGRRRSAGGTGGRAGNQALGGDRRWGPPVGAHPCLCERAGRPSPGLDRARCVPASNGAVPPARCSWDPGSGRTPAPGRAPRGGVAGGGPQARGGRGVAGPLWCRSPTLTLPKSSCLCSVYICSVRSILWAPSLHRLTSCGARTPRAAGQRGHSPAARGPCPCGCPEDHLAVSSTPSGPQFPHWYHEKPGTDHLETLPARPPGPPLLGGVRVGGLGPLSPC